MANKRDLKRSLNYISSTLFAECIATYLSTDKENSSVVDNTLTCIIKTHSDFIRRVSHPEPGMKPKKFYKILVEDFNKQVGELINHIQEI